MLNTVLKVRPFKTLFRSEKAVKFQQQMGASLQRPVELYVAGEEASYRAVLEREGVSVKFALCGERKSDG